MIKNTPSVVVVSGPTMGTFFTVKYIPSQNINERGNEIAAGINDILAEVNRQMSTYREDSEISRFNRYRQTDWFPVSAWFAEVTEEALKISADSQGAFDITVAPLVNLWGFGPDKRTLLPPSEEDIRGLLSTIGSQYLQVRESPAALKKDKQTLTCDLSAIAKGFAVDAIGGYLESREIGRYMVEIGGEVRARGINDSGSAWRIGIETPDEFGNLRKIVLLKDKALATSGDYRNYFEKDGIRYSHTINPRTGRPIRHALASVSIIDESSMKADGLATAINVMGPEKGYEFARQRNLAVYMLVRDGRQFRELMTPGFEEYLLEEDAPQPPSRFLSFLRLFLLSLLLFLVFGFILYWTKFRKRGCSCNALPEGETCEHCAKQGIRQH